MFLFRSQFLHNSRSQFYHKSPGGRSCAAAPNYLQYEQYSALNSTLNRPFSGSKRTASSTFHIFRKKNFRFFHCGSSLWYNKRIQDTHQNDIKVKSQLHDKSKLSVKESISSVTPTRDEKELLAKTAALGTSSSQKHFQRQASAISEPIHPLHQHHEDIDHQLTEFASKSILTPHLGNLKKASYSNALKLNLIHAWHSIMMNILPLGSATLGNQVKIYTDGDEAFREMWQSIDEAKEEICYETYILKADAVGLETLRRLTEAAKRGVKVTFIYDYMGSSLYISQRHLADLTNSGAKVVTFNPVLPHLIHIFTREKEERKPILFRNHRKIMVVDGKLAFCGGLNTSSDYAGPNLGIARFRDTHMKIEGPAVHYLTEVFKDSLSEATMHLLRKESTESVKSTELVKSMQHNLNREAIMKLIRSKSLPKHINLHGSKDEVRQLLETLKDEVSKNWKMRIARYKQKLDEFSRHAPAASGTSETAIHSEPSTSEITSNTPSPVSSGSSPVTAATSDVDPSPSHHSSGIFAQVLSSNVLRNKIHLQNAMIEIIRRSGREVLITNPFLLPPKRLMNALLSAAERGVQVKILTSGTSDTPYMRWASTHTYHEFLSHPNIEIYEYQPRIMHAKTVTVDGLFCSIGSFNFDLLSGLRNLEVNVMLIDEKSASILKEQFYKDREESVPVTLESLAARKWYERLLHWFSYSVLRILSVIV